MQLNQLKISEYLNIQFLWRIGALAVVFIFSSIVTSCLEGEGESARELDSQNASSPVYDWPLFRGDPEMQGVTKEIIAPPLKLAWSHEPEVEEGKRRPPIEASPVISDGVVFVGTMGGDFLAVDLKTGEQKWMFKADGPVMAPAGVSGESLFWRSVWIYLCAIHRDRRRAMAL